MVQRDLLTLSLYQLLASNRGGLFIVYFPLFLIEDKGATFPEALALLSAAYVVASLVSPVAGRWSDRLGRRKSFLLGAELGALPFFAIIPFLSTFWLAGIAFVAAQTVLAVGAPALSAYVADVTRENERGLGYGWLNATASAGAVAGTIIAGIVTVEYGLAALFPFVVAIMIGTVLIVALLVREVRQPPTERRARWTELRPVATFSFAVSIRGLGAGAIATTFGTYAYLLGANTFEVGLVAVAGLLAQALAGVPLGRMVDRTGEIAAIWYGTLLTLGAIGIFAVASTWTVLIPAQVVRNLGFALLSPGMLAWVARASPPGRRAEYLGYFALINSTMWSLGPLAGAVAIQFAGLNGLFAFAVGTTVASVLLVFFLYRRRAFGRTLEPATTKSGVF